MNRAGIAAGFVAYLIWGLVPLFFRLLADVPAIEIIAHRVVWSLALMAVILAWAPGFRAVRETLAEPRRLARVALGAAMVAINWTTFVWAINAGRVLETALGYFMVPLLNVALGIIVLKERLRPLQWAAVGLAALGVAAEAARVGGLPWVALVLAFSFGAYGLLRKRLPLDAASGLFMETLCMAPFAVIYLGLLAGQGHGAFGGGMPRDLLLVAAGIVTAMPLLLFAVAARRLPLSTLGFLQYVAPTVSFLVAVLAFGETLSPARMLVFGAIWAGLALYTADMLRHARAA